MLPRRAFAVAVLTAVAGTASAQYPGGYPAGGGGYGPAPGAVPAGGWYGPGMNGMVGPPEGGYGPPAGPVGYGPNPDFGAGLGNPGPADTPRFWGTTDYMVYFLKPLQLPVTTVTYGTSASRGVLGQPGTVVAVGPREFDPDRYSGVQVTLGGWLNADKDIGIEGSGFLLETRGEQVLISGGTPDAPILARPFTESTTGNANSRLVSVPGAFLGSTSVSSSTLFWGAEGVIVGRLADNGGAHLDATVGFKFFNLEESLTLADEQSVLAGGFTNFNGTVGTRGPARVQVTDKYSTENRFYGGTTGLRLTYQTNSLMFGVTGKVGLGYVNQIVNVSGTSTLTNPAVPLPTTVPGGLYAVPGVIGKYTKDSFAAVPELGVKAGCQVTDYFGISLGYNVLYVSRVIRPGDQVSTIVNPNAIPTSATLGVPFGTTPVGVPFRQSDFYAHGVTIGLTLTY